MDERTSNNHTNRRRPAKRRRRWQYYIPTIVMGVLSVVCIATVTLAVIAVIQRQDPSLNTPDNNTQGIVDSNENSKPNDTTKPNNNDSTKPDNKPNTDVVTLMEEAEFIAQGYDYQKAIEMLKGYKDYASTPELVQKVKDYEKLDSQLVTYASPETITHIFFHSLVVDTSRAFDGDDRASAYHRDMTTVDEFVAMMEEMYARGFVLISPYDMAYEVTDASGTHFTYGNIRLPAGKKPFLMSQDDVNYYSAYVSNKNGKNETPVFADTDGDGLASRIVIGEDGYPTCEYMDEHGNVTTGDYDLVPILEKFIQQHPDFSYHGARAILAVTGYEGVFGYRTKPSYQAQLDAMHKAGQYPYSYDEEVQMAKDVVKCLKDHNWILASHSYGHPAYGNISASRVEADSTKWENTVQPVIGDTDILIYPYGSDIAGVSKYNFDNEKFQILYEDGYRYFFNVDSSVHWNQLGSNYFRGGRRNLDGYRMYYNPELLKDLFDVEDVWDENRPTLLLPNPDPIILNADRKPIGIFLRILDTLAIEKSRRSCYGKI